MIVLLAASAASLSAMPTQVIRLTNGEWPPYQSAALPHYGAASWLAKRAFELAGYEVHYDFFPWKRAYYMARTGQYDGSLIWSYSAQREAYFVYSQPFIYTKTVFFYHRDKPFEWEDWEDLRGKTIGITDGYNYGEAFSDAVNKGIFTADTVSSDELNLKRLIAKRIDAFPLSLDVGRYMLRLHFNEQQISQIAWHPKPLRQTAYHLIISRKRPDARKLIEAFNRGVATLRASGEYDQIMHSVMDSVTPR